MADKQAPEAGTLMIAALLLLALGFAGYWIMEYAQIGSAPWELARWFGILATVIVVVGLLLYWRTGRD